MGDGQWDEEAEHGRAASVIVGGLNWGPVGLLDFNGVGAVFGEDTAARVIYVIVGLAAIRALTSLRVTRRGVVSPEGTGAQWAIKEGWAKIATRLKYGMR